MAVKIPSLRGQALVAIVNNLQDWRIVQEKLWYRVPADTALRRWPPQWLAFYQTKIFKDEAYSIRYFGKIKRIDRVKRVDLFPSELQNAKSGREYYQCFLESLEALPRPIVSFRQRRIVFIPTTHHKLMSAEEINDLHDDSPLEDALWEELKKLKLKAERQWHMRISKSSYFLDFALFCEEGQLNIETDGDSWHITPERAPEDNRRNNDLASGGWQVLRFSTAQIREQMTEYCVPRIVETVNRLGGMESLTDSPRCYYPTDDGIVQQLTLFDRKSAYLTEPEENED